MNNCDAGDRDLQFSSARLLEQCLTTENRAHVVENGLEKVVTVACVCTKNTNSADHSRVGTGKFIFRFVLFDIMFIFKRKFSYTT